MGTIKIGKLGCTSSFAHSSIAISFMTQDSSPSSLCELHASPSHPDTQPRDDTALHVSHISSSRPSPTPANGNGSHWETNGVQFDN
mmetsp:Transcript_9746/g.17598  ORF Transcript_9746/g.17598 Transcript_9746/m.17598 type:complete len:86 (+) Transcript_9746:51-308(+)